MMEHLDEGVLQSLLDDQLSENDRRQAREHLAACVGCRALYGELRAANQSLRDALGLLDADRPAVGVVEPPIALPVRRPVPAWRRVPAIRAAAMVSIFAAAAAAAVPGSPVRGWLGMNVEEPEVVTYSTEARATAAEAVEEAGTSVAPIDGQVEVLILEPIGRLEIRASLVDDAQASTVAVNDPQTRFRMVPGRIEVVAPGEGVMRIEIPRSVSAAVVRVDGEDVIAKEEGGLVVTAATGSSFGDSAVVEVFP